MKKVYAIVLAAGNGSRMGGEIAKQYQPLCGKPVLYYTLSAFERSAADEVVLVVSEQMTEYARREIAERFGFRKVTAVIAGGATRCDSVCAGMRCVRARMESGSFGAGECMDMDGAASCAGGAGGMRGEDIVLVHDGARPFVTPELIAKMIDAAQRDACAIPAVPVKDTIKRVQSGFVGETPERNGLYAVQTPQAFRFSVLWEAFERYKERTAAAGKAPEITDDAMLVESMLGRRIAVAEGDYRNIKLTTPEDMVLARAFLAERGESADVQEGAAGELRLSQ